MECKIYLYFCCTIELEFGEPYPLPVYITICLLVTHVPSKTLADVIGGSEPPCVALKGLRVQYLSTNRLFD